MEAATTIPTFSSFGAVEIAGNDFGTIRRFRCFGTHRKQCDCLASGNQPRPPPGLQHSVVMDWIGAKNRTPVPSDCTTNRQDFSRPGLPYLSQRQRRDYSGPSPGSPLRIDRISLTPLRSRTQKRERRRLSGRSRQTTVSATRSISEDNATSPTRTQPSHSGSFKASPCGWKTSDGKAQSSYRSLSRGRSASYRDDFLDYISSNVSQLFEAPLVEISELILIQPHQAEDRCVKITHVDNLSRRAGAEVVGLPK